MNDPKKSAHPDGVQRGYPERQPGQEPVDKAPDDQVDRRDRTTDPEMGEGSPVTPGSGKPHPKPVELPEMRNEKSNKDDLDRSRNVPSAEHLN